MVREDAQERAWTSGKDCMTQEEAPTLGRGDKGRREGPQGSSQRKGPLTGRLEGGPGWALQAGKERARLRDRTANHLSAGNGSQSKNSSKHS